MVRKPAYNPLNKQNGSTSPESIISLSILFLLVLIGVLIFLQQSHFDEKYFDASVMQAGQSGGKTASAAQAKSSVKIEVVPPGGFSPMSDEESFDKITLSDKIDGKAEGYLAAGFVSLTCRRFVSNANQNQWFEFYLYDMDLPRNAYSVYSSQKREGVTQQDFTKFAYSTENAIFFACGKLYIEVIASIKDEALVKKLVVMAKGFIEKQPAENVELPELRLLPTENLDAQGISLISKNGFGYDKFDNIVTAAYRVQGKKVTAFVSIRDSKEKAEALAKGYDDTISEFVGKDRLKSITGQIPGVIIANVFDEYEIFFTKGNIIAGIHSAPDQKTGEELAVSLYKKISGMIK